MPFVWSLVSVAIVSLISFIGIAAFFLRDSLRTKIIFYLVAFSAGVLMGDAFLHLIPESLENGKPETVSIFMVAGFILFLLVERFLHWRHCHEGETCDHHPHPFTRMILIGDGVHNIMDGVVIAVSFAVSIPLGIATTLAVIAHEIPQEIGDYHVLIYGGYTPQKALFWNFISALSAFLGVFLGWSLGSMSNTFSIVLPLTAGGFLYIAAVDLLPEVHKETSLKKSVWALICFLVGILVMWGLKIFLK